MIKYLVFSLVILITACGNALPGKSYSPGELDSFKQRVDSYRNYLPTCLYTKGTLGVSKDTCLAEGTGTGDGDAMLWSGLLCLSGEAIGCETAQNSFDSDGRAWRSPGRVGKDVDEAFSRDMFLGAMAYFVGSHDVTTASRYLTWLSAHENRLCFDRCEMTWTSWAVMADVWQYLGLPRTKIMIWAQYMDEVGQMAGALNNEGYALHLVAVNVLIRQKIGNYNSTWKAIAKTIVDRRPNNPFFVYLYEGNNQKLLDLVNTKAPTSIPSSRSEWTFERDTTDVESWDNSMLWEWLFLYNLMSK